VRAFGAHRSSTSTTLHVVPTACLGRRIGIVAPAREREVKRALGYALGWAELKIV